MTHTRTIERGSFSFGVQESVFCGTKPSPRNRLFFFFLRREYLNVSIGRKSFNLKRM